MIYIEKKLKLNNKIQKNFAQVKLSTISTQSIQEYLNRYELILLTK